MSQPIPPTPHVDSPPAPTPCQGKALHVLREALAAARAAGGDVWPFAVEIGPMCATSLSDTDLRCLLCWGYLEHAQERTSGHASECLFQPLSALVLPKGACFVLTATGQEVAPERDAEKSMTVVMTAVKQPEVPCSRPAVPHWDRESRQLWRQDCLIKEFHRPAVNQELVLAALEEEGWPTRIDDPLPPTADIDPKVRLHDTIKALNRHHRHRIICFGGDGTGLGIRWVVARRQ